MKHDDKQAIALWRLGVLGPLMSARLDHGDRRRYFAEAAARTHERPTALWCDRSSSIGREYTAPSLAAYETMKELMVAAVGGTGCGVIANDLWMLGSARA
jgi:hypothetical protein